MIYFRTCAYNAERTLEKAVNSILNQTVGEFVYYLLDNGSTDKTREIIQRYEEKDCRIVPFYCDRNKDFTNNKEFWELPRSLKEGDFFCILDADDTYEPTFLEEMIKFQAENDLDIAICGTRFIDANTNEICGERVFLDSLVVSDSQEFECRFPELHWNLRQVWGKLYNAQSAATSFTTEFPEWFPMAYGGDTIYVYECVKMSKSIGVYNKCLHNYTISFNSVSYKWINGREECDFTLFEKAKELLIQKCGYVSPRNLNFLYAVQFNALRDTLNVLFKSNQSAEHKVEIMKGIFENPVTKQTFLEKGNVTQEDKTKLLTGVACSIIELAQNIPEISLQNIADIYTVFNPSFSEMISTDKIAWYMKKLPIVVRNVVLGEYEYAVNNLLVYLAKSKKTDFEVDYPFVLGQVLTSLCNEEAKYVYFSKQLIRWCIENNQLERARKDLDEWLRILPEDKDLVELNQRC